MLNPDLEEKNPKLKDNKERADSHKAKSSRVKNPELGLREIHSRELLSLLFYPSLTIPIFLVRNMPSKQTILEILTSSKVSKCIRSTHN